MKEQVKTRAQLKGYLGGRGIEIGALHKPVDLSGTQVEHVAYVDSMPLEALRQHYPELDDLPLVSPDIIADGTTLDGVASGTLDFIIANHLIEHLENPLLALEIWYAKLRPGGVVFMAVPDKRVTFDKHRPLTPLSHLIDDYRAGAQERKARSVAHFHETAELIEGRTGTDAENRVAALRAANYSIHHHVWTFESFVEVLHYVIEIQHVPFRIIDYSSPMPGGDEFIFILGKGPNRYHPAIGDALTLKRQWAVQRVKNALSVLKNEGPAVFFRKCLGHVHRMFPPPGA